MHTPFSIENSQSALSILHKVNILNFMWFMFYEYLSMTLIFSVLLDNFFFSVAFVK